MSYHIEHSFEDYQQRWNLPESTTILTTVLVSVVTGAFVLFKVLEFTGYPVWLWLHQIAQMSSSSSPYASDSESSDDSMQRGGMLGSLFGLNSGSLLQKGVRGLAGALSSGPSNAPPGLGNISNSCYQNSVIQGLAALPSLRDYLSKMTTEHTSFTPDTTNGALFDMISKLNDPNNQGQSFWIRGKLKSMSTFQQQDAQEYYSKVLDELDKEIKKASGSKRRSSASWAEAAKSLNILPETSESETKERKDETGKSEWAAEQAKILPNPLDGLIAQRVGCTSCGYSEGLSLISFNCITVSLGNNHAYDIRECLDEYTKLEYIDGVECSKCTLLKLQKTLTPLAAAKPGSPFEAKLNTVSEMIDDEKFDDNALVKTLNIPKKNWVQSSKSKQIVVARAPKALVLHVNRSIFDEMTGAQYKNTAGVSYPGILDLGNWCLGSSPSGSRQPDISPEEWPRDPKESMLPDHEAEPMTDSPFQYKLRAAVTHYGSHGNGHYVCYRPAPKVVKQVNAEDRVEQEQKNLGEQWWRFSDDSVYAVPEEQAHQGNVFMLFYERIDESEPSASIQDVPQVLAIPEDAPLPPVIAAPASQEDLVNGAIEIPLPEDDEFELTPPATPAVQLDSQSPEIDMVSSSTPIAYATPPPENLVSESSNTDHEEPETSEAESEDTPSTQLTSDIETESKPPTPKPFTPVSPQLMRTAGNAASRGQGNRKSLPLVSAT